MRPSRSQTARILLAGSLLGGAARARDVWDRLEGRVIREVRLQIVDVYDRSVPEEDTPLGRLADALHVTTRPSVVRGYLLFREGDPLQARRVRETERALRSLPFLRDASILPEELPDGGVRLVVRTKDAWTLLAAVSFSHLGGQNRVGGTLLDRNVLGLGKGLSWNISKDPERTTRTLAWADPAVLGSRATLAAGYSSHSDGQTRYLALGRPFYSFDTPWSAGVQMLDDSRDNSVYDRTDTVGITRARTRTVTAWTEFSLGMVDARVMRVGLWGNYYQQAIGAVTGDPALGGALPAPADRKVQSLMVRWTLAEDRFVQQHDLAAMTRTEDLPSGWNAYAAAGLAQSFSAGARTVPAVDLSALKGWDLGPDAYLAWGAGFLGRREEARWRAASAWSTLTGYRRLQPWQILAGQVAYTAQAAPDLPAALYLGGTDGSRGYRNYLYAGDRRWLAALEDRFNTDATILSTVRIGFVARLDAAMVRRLADGQWTPVFPSASAGLRLGDLRSAFGRVYCITFAVPLRKDARTDPYQINLSASTGF